MRHWAPERFSMTTLRTVWKRTATRTLQCVRTTDASSPKLGSFWCRSPQTLKALNLLQALWMAVSASRALAPSLTESLQNNNVSGAFFEVLV